MARSDNYRQALSSLNTTTLSMSVAPDPGERRSKTDPL